MGFCVDPNYCAPIIDYVYREGNNWKEAEKLFNTGATTIYCGWKHYFNLPHCTLSDRKEQLEKLIEANGCTTTLEYLQMIQQKNNDRFNDLYKLGQAWKVHKKEDGKWYKTTMKDGIEVEEEM